MYIVVVYDVGQKRVGKMLKLCRRYLSWIQNSVLEGNLTEAQLAEFITEAKALMDSRVDSLIIFKARQERWLDKQVIGQERGQTGNFL